MTHVVSKLGNTSCLFVLFPSLGRPLSPSAHKLTSDRCSSYSCPFFTDLSTVDAYAISGQQMLIFRNMPSRYSVTRTSIQECPALLRRLYYSPVADKVDRKRTCSLDHRADDIAGRQSMLDAALDRRVHGQIVWFVYYLRFIPGSECLPLRIYSQPPYRLAASNAGTTSMIHRDLELTSAQNNEPDPLGHVFVHPHLLDNTALGRSSQRQLGSHKKINPALVSPCCRLRSNPQPREAKTSCATH